MISSNSRIIPFTAIIGQEEMKKALILNVINPKIGGVLIRGEKGTAKSTAVRALAELLPEIEVVEHCPFSCDPHNPESMCSECLPLWEKEGKLDFVKRKIGVINLPLGATEDRVVGTLDIEKAIREGIKALQPGLLASANRALLYVDEVNLLDDHIADLLLDSSALGVNVIEREGIAVSHPANFSLIGTMNPEEGEIRPQLLDRFGLQVSVTGLGDAEERIGIVNLINEFDSHPEAVKKKYKPAQQHLAKMITEAIDILHHVKIHDRLAELIVSTCMEFDIKTHRAEITTLRAAKGIAALKGRKAVHFEDVREAMQLALPHRMRRKPFEPPVLDREKLDKKLESWKKKPQKPKRRLSPEEKREKAADYVIPREESEEEESIFDIGEHIEPNVLKQFEKDRKIRKKVSGRRVRTFAIRRGTYVRPKMPSDRLTDVAVDATIRAASPYVGSRAAKHVKIKIEKEDIREKVRIGKISTPTVFAVDASGSMFTYERMESAKGAVFSMLVDSYQKRDKVGLVAFREHRGEEMLPMCSSLDWGIKCLKDLASGGPTPLSSGLQKALEMLVLEKRKNPEALPILVLVSDGRANVPLAARSDIREELINLTNQAWKNKIHMIFIDVEKERATDSRHGEYKQVLIDRMSYYRMDQLVSSTIQSIVAREKRMLESAFL